MIRRVSRAGLIIAAALLLAACQTTVRDTYEAPLREGAVLGPDRAGAVQTQPDPTTRADAGLVDEGTLRYGGDTYRISDLSPGQRPSSDTLEAGLWLTMKRLEDQIRHSGSRVLDPELNAYVSDVACRVAGKHCDDVRVYIMRVPAFNATMAPNGMMQVWTGLLLRVRNEAQLAAVLGHEVGHYLRRHSTQQRENLIDAANFLAFFRIATAGIGIGYAGDIATMIATGQIFAFSREQEREADGYGLLLMNRSGYDPREFGPIWQNLIREQDADPDKEYRSPFYATHPAPNERSEILTEIGGIVAGKMAKPEIGRNRFLEIILPRRAEWLRDELNQRTFETSNELFDMLLEDDPNPAEILFFKGELHRLRGDEGDDAKALEFYDQSMAARGKPPGDLYRSKGLVHNRRGEPSAAVKAFETYLRINPDAADRLIIGDMIKRLASS